MNTTLTVESLYELIIERLSLHEIYWANHDVIQNRYKTTAFHLYKPRTSWILKIVNDYDIEQRYGVSIHLNYIIEKYDKPRFKKNIYTRKK